MSKNREYCANNKILTFYSSCRLLYVLKMFIAAKAYTTIMACFNKM